MERAQEDPVIGFSVNNMTDQSLDAQEIDQAELVKLNLEQNTLLSLIKTREVSIKKKVQRLAAILHRRIDLADPSLANEGFQNYSINQISTILGKILRPIAPSIADNIRHYVDPMYRDPSQQRNVIGDGGITYREDKAQILVELTNYHKEIIQQIPQMTRADMCAVYEMLTQGNDSIKNVMETTATAQHFLLPGHEPEIERKTPREQPRYTMQWQAVQAYANTMMKYADFLYTYPGPKEKEPQWAAGWIRAGRFYENLMNEKLSLSDFQWISKVKAMIHQSTHGAAGEDLVQTMICDNCWDDDRGCEVEGANAEMVYDFDSPTEWRCSTCGGIEGKWRDLSREQVGDNKGPVYTKAEAYISLLHGFYESHIHYVTNPQKRIYGRKILVAPRLRKKS